MLVRQRKLLCSFYVQRNFSLSQKQIRNNNFSAWKQYFRSFMNEIQLLCLIIYASNLLCVLQMPSF